MSYQNHIPVVKKVELDLANYATKSDLKVQQASIL